MFWPPHEGAGTGKTEVAADREVGRGPEGSLLGTGQTLRPDAGEWRGGQAHTVGRSWGVESTPEMPHRFWWVSLPRWGTWGGPLRRGEEQMARQASGPCPKAGSTPEEPLHLGCPPRSSLLPQLFRARGSTLTPTHCPPGVMSLGEQRGLQHTPCSNPPPSLTSQHPAAAPQPC